MKTDTPTKAREIAAAYGLRLLALAVATAWQAAPALAAERAVATVEHVQAPAWLIRQGVERPLAPGMALQSGDSLRTGEEARAYVVLADGSRIKLAESARSTLYSRSLNPAKFFRGALDIVAGAFRYTTARLQRQRPDLAIRVGTATIGIRGTDLWGKTDREGDLVALLDGQIDVTHAGTTTELTRPLSYFDAPRGQQAAVKDLDMATLKTLARQTEIEPGDGATQVQGPWQLRIADAPTQGEALELYDRLRDAGYVVRIRPYDPRPRPKADGAEASSPAGSARNWRYRVLAPGFANEREANAAALRLKKRLGLTAVAMR
ncbi:MAG TPA: FecR family protein [Rhodocyclaceae bacterium]|nr:FecR family protein [Rhodocyclaceae bacterium]